MTTPPDTDLVAVREAVSPRTRDSELSLARTWGTIIARRAGVDQPPRRRPARRLVPAAAAATVAVVALGTVTLLGPRWDGLGFLPADPGPPSDTESYLPNLDPPSVQAVAGLVKLAEAAEQGEPVTIENGQLIYVRSQGWATEFRVGPPGDPHVGVVRPQPREGWYHPDGMVPLRVLAGDEVLYGDGAGEPVEAEPTAELPAGPYAATPQWLAGLPTEPDQLRAELRANLKDDHTWSTDHAVWTAMSELYATAEILIPPEVRAALLRAFTELRGLTAVEADIEGRLLVGIRHIERDSGDEILFDPETGRAVGRRSISLHEGLRLIQPTGGPAVDLATPDPGISYQSLWTQAIVDELGDTG